MSVRYAAVILVSFLFGCTYSPPIVQSHIVNVSRAPDSRKLAVMVSKTTQRNPEGINSFPDGGSPTILSQEAIIYLCDFDNHSIRQVGIYLVDEKQQLSFEPRLLGWKNDMIYFQVSGCAPNWKNECWGERLSNRQYQMSILDGEVKISSELPESLVQAPNSPLMQIPGEKKYMRTSLSWTQVDVTTTSPDTFRPALTLENNGILKFID